MKCVVCHGEDIFEQSVDEEVHAGEDIVLAPISCLVCQTCGERYYDTNTMHHLEKLREELRSGSIPLEQVGRILRMERTIRLAQAA